MTKFIKFIVIALLLSLLYGHIYMLINFEPKDTRNFADLVNVFETAYDRTAKAMEESEANDVGAISGVYLSRDVKMYEYENPKKLKQALENFPEKLNNYVKYGRFLIDGHEPDIVYFFKKLENDNNSSSNSY